MAAESGASLLHCICRFLALFCRTGRANQCPKLGENGLNADMPQRPNLTPIGSRVEASMAAPGELRQLIEVP